ncbi:acetolactate decarboxylase [Pendulispora rubella]|uniref:Alpha-acetolactate decarboxylase n=1 Tax=Pendulispora rubella TaxID=2741070 RepID=A0ABZ2L7I7_9BACT
MSLSRRSIALVGSVLLMACTAESNAPHAPAAGGSTLFHAGMVGALLAGVYDGQFEIEAVRKHGDFGLGGFHALDGEMVVLDGHVYQVTSDGKVHGVPDAAKTPFAAVTFFRPEQRIAWSSTQGRTPAFEAFLERERLAPQRLYAIKITGRFKRLLARSVAAQTPPYRPLPEVIAASQKTFPFENVEGTMVGFRLPQHVNGVNLPGYHFHFLDRARTAGGHVLEYEIDQADVEMQLLHGYTVELPEGAAFYEVDLARDRRNDIRAIE